VFESHWGQELSILYEAQNGSRIFSYGYWGFSLEVKRPGREADHSSPTSAEITKTWVYTSTPPYAFMALKLVKHRDNFTF
jgi:hypothetical protein